MLTCKCNITSYCRHFNRKLLRFADRDMFMRYTHYGIGHPTAVRKLTRDCADADLMDHTGSEVNEDDEEWESNNQPRYRAGGDEGGREGDVGEDGEDDGDDGDDDEDDDEDDEEEYDEDDVQNDLDGEVMGFGEDIDDEADDDEDYLSF